MSAVSRRPHHAHSSPADHLFRELGFPASPFSPFANSFFNNQRSLINSLWSGLDSGFPETRPMWQPSFNVSETETAYELEGEFPGLSEKDKISVEFTDDQTLVIKGRTEHSREVKPTAAEEEGESHDSSTADAETTETEPESATKGKEVAKAPESGAVAPAQASHQPRYWLSERSVGSFQRVFTFPETVDQDAVTAKLENGLLKVVVPKKEKVQKSKKIEIQ